jgi:hypothetical protein
MQDYGNIVPGVFTPVLAKHSKSFSLIDCVSGGVDRMQRTFEPMRKQVESWQRSELTDVRAKVVIYEAFVGGKLEPPKHLIFSWPEARSACMPASPSNSWIGLPRREMEKRRSPLV